METTATILHADLDAFYASVEQLLAPSLRGKPVAVGGGVVLAASYEAKASGVRGGMPGRRARELCPQLTFVGGHFKDYQRLGDAAIEGLGDFTPLVERISIDEAFADVAGCIHLFGPPAEIARAIRRRVRSELGLPISVGVARTKHLAKIASQVAKPDGLQPNLPPVPLGKTGTRYARAINQLGWHWWPSDIAVATMEYDGRGKCINLGHCTPGCAQGAKASVDITYWPHALRAGVELRTRCRVREIATNEHGMASGAIYYDAEGVEHFQPAEVVILACNSVGTARLLLNSASARFPKGLANSSGLVGKNLMFHPYARIAGYFDEVLDGYRGPGNCIWSQEFYETDRSRGFVRGYTFEFSRGQGPVMAAVHGNQIGRLPWGAEHHRAYRKLFCHRTGMVAICEDLPEEHNTVTLDPVLKDSDGIPAPKIDYTFSENSRCMMDFAVARGTEILRAAGAYEVGSELPLTDGGWHLMGTARMGTDPARSVVNEWGRSHDVKNLFIVDGSLFVTSGGVNPTSTIQAIALYIADQMKRRLADLFD